MKSTRLWSIIFSLVAFALFNNSLWANSQRLYKVELLVFQYAQNKAQQTENWLINNQEYAPETLNPHPYTALPQSQFSLSSESWALRQKLNYPVLLHTAWQQPISGPRRAQRFAITDNQQQLFGSLKISRSNFIDIEAELNLPLAPQYIIKEKRRMRAGEVHYFDHPAFGVLVKIT